MNKIKFIFSTLFILLLVFSCNKKKAPKLEEAINVVSAQADVDSLKTQEHSHWSYEGKSAPNYWVNLSENECGGSKQSPINIIKSEAVQDTVSLLNKTDLHYLPTTKIYSVINNGHTIQYNLKMGNYLEYNNEKYELVQFHFHAPSEHLLNGMRYPLEIHLVHLSKDKRILVISFLVEEGDENDYFNQMESVLPLAVNKEESVNFNTDFLKQLDNDLMYYHYIGSLTTPPCTEGVDWFVMQTPITMSERQVKLLSESMPENNYRPVQPLNGRVVTYN